MVLIDAGYLMARSRYAFGALTTSSGIHTGAVYGTIKTLQQIRKNYPSEKIILCLDSYSKWREDLLPSYKSKRDSHQPEYMGSEKQLQRDMEKRAVVTIAANIMNVEVVSASEAEADDLLAKYTEESTEGAIIFTADKDMWQLTKYDRVKITNKIERGNFVFSSMPAELAVVPVENLSFYRAIQGDSSDEIPKIRGLKSKEVIAICQEVGSPEELLRKEGDLISRFNSAESLIKDIEKLKINYEVCKLPSGRVSTIWTTFVPMKESLEKLEELELYSLRSVLQA